MRWVGGGASEGVDLTTVEVGKSTSPVLWKLRSEV